MGELLTTGAVLAVFLAGGVALFAPCCIVFLAPSYLAAAVKNRRWRLLPLTFITAQTLRKTLSSATRVVYRGVWMKVPDATGECPLRPVGRLARSAW
jgi:cytochrome c biogenesis protein CcdA